MPAAASIASMPVHNMGLITGANAGEWFDGSLFRLPVRSASAYFFGSTPPTIQYLGHVPQARGMTVKSPLAEAGLAGLTRSAPRRWRRASAALQATVHHRKIAEWI
jgi:hypothetical protein